MDFDLEGQIIEGYEFVEKLGSGAVGEVWKVLKDGEEFAIKFIRVGNKQELRDAAEMEKNFANYSMFLNCPFLVKYISTFTNKKNTILYLVMEYCSKGNLGKLIEKEVDASKGIILNESRLLKIMTQLLLGIDELHRNRILHRDVKAENVFINAADVIKLGDLGCGRILESTNRQTKASIGTPYYMAPEVWEGTPYSYAADVWSLGVLFYRLCGGKYPFEGANACVILKAVMKGKYDALPKKLFAPALCTLIDSMLQQNPKKRPTVSEILSNVRSLSKEMDVPQFIIGLAKRHPDCHREWFQMIFKDALDRKPTLAQITLFLESRTSSTPSLSSSPSTSSPSSTPSLSSSPSTSSPSSTPSSTPSLSSSPSTFLPISARLDGTDPSVNSVTIEDGLGTSFVLPVTATTTFQDLLGLLCPHLHRHPDWTEVVSCTDPLHGHPASPRRVNGSGVKDGDVLVARDYDRVLHAETGSRPLICRLTVRTRVGEVRQRAGMTFGVEAARVGMEDQEGNVLADDDATISSQVKATHQTHINLIVYPLNPVKSIAIQPCNAPRFVLEVNATTTTAYVAQAVGAHLHIPPTNVLLRRTTGGAVRIGPDNLARLSMRPNEVLLAEENTGSDSDRIKVCVGDKDGLLFMVNVTAATTVQTVRTQAAAALGCSPARVVVYAEELHKSHDRHNFDAVKIQDLHMHYSEWMTVHEAHPIASVTIQNPDGKKVTVNVKPQTPASDLWTKINDQDTLLIKPDGYLVRKCRLTLAQYNVRDKDVLSVLPSLKNANDSQTAQLFVKTPAGKTICVDMDLFDTVEDLKAIIHDKEDILPSQQRLIFGGYELLDGCALAEFNVKKESTLYVVMSLRG